MCKYHPYSSKSSYKNSAVSIISFPHPPELKVTSTLPIGAGLGSSAALCTAAAGAILSGLNGVPLDQTLTEQVTKWAFSAEHIFHGTPSGIDNYVSANGGAVHYSPTTLNASKFNSVPTEHLPRLLVFLRRENGKLAERDARALIGKVA